MLDGVHAHYSASKLVKGGFAAGSCPWSGSGRWQGTSISRRPLLLMRISCIWLETCCGRRGFISEHLEER